MSADGEERAAGLATTAVAPTEAAPETTRPAASGNALLAEGLGRFRVLERIGAGGMGVVYAAYDPDLDRGVALKLIRVPARGRDAAVAEARVLARLAHPNVVPIYDVGASSDVVYLVMELVRGETLGRWCQGRDLDEVVDAFRQAGEGLAAAHAAGLVHRDVKPDNVLVGTDDRVRLVDLGIAVEADSAEGPRHVAGTPRYMAPEQAAGAAATPAADQYSFCVALDELLPAGAARPRWLAAIVERGRAADPAARYPTMRALLHALADDPARRRRRRMVVAAVALVGLGVFAAGRRSHDGQPPPCADGAARLAGTWSSDDRTAALARLGGLGAYGQSEAPRLASALSAHGARWLAAYREACLARRTGSTDARAAAIADRRMICLDRGRSALGAVADIVRKADVDTLSRVALAVQALPTPDACLVADTSTVEPPPAAIAARVTSLRADLERARIQTAAGAASDGFALAHATVDAARALGYRQLLSEALLAQGRARANLNPRIEAVAPFTEAASLAFTTGDDNLAIEAWARAAWARGTTTSPETALEGLDVIESLASRSGPTYAVAVLHNTVGAIEAARGHRDRARVAVKRALAEARAATVPDALQVTEIRTNLAMLTDDEAQREAMLVESEGELERMLGRDHPEVLNDRRYRAAWTTDLGSVARILDATCSRYQLHPGYRSDLVGCWSELAFVRHELGDAAGAASAIAHAAPLAPTLPTFPDVAPYHALWTGNAAQAAAGFELAAEALASSSTSWDRRRRAELLLGLGRARQALGEPAAARRALEVSVAELEALAPKMPAAYTMRRLTRARAELALVRAATGASAADTAALASAAADALRHARGRAEEIQTLAALARSGR